MGTARPGNPHFLPHTLTPRQWQVAGLVAQGYTSQEIARTLHVDYETVKDHIHESMQRLGARNRAHLAALTTKMAGEWQDMTEELGHAPAPDAGGP